MRDEKIIGLKYDKWIFKPGDIKILHDKLENGQKNLYIVSTPLQLLSAIEAQGYYQTENNILVILFFTFNKEQNVQQIFDLLKYFPYSKLITYQHSETSIYRSFIKYLVGLWSSFLLGRKLGHKSRTQQGSY